MKTKIKNWLENHEFIYGCCLLAISLGSIAFGGAYLGAQAGVANMDVTLNVAPTEVIVATSEGTK